jgi:hypothetical protein
MAQKTVQLVIGRILTDEEFRATFLERPTDTLISLRDQGYALANDEIAALVQTDVRLWQRGSKWVDVGLQRCRLKSPAGGDDKH